MYKSRMHHVCKVGLFLFLFLKDALTDVTFSRKRMDIDKEPYSDLKTFCHFGLYQAAEHIMGEMEANNILATAFSNYPVTYYIRDL